MSEKNYSITELFGENLAHMLSDKIQIVSPQFEAISFISQVKKAVSGKTYSERTTIIAEQLRLHLPEDYETAVQILIDILGDENPNQTGMFKEYYWAIPIGKFISEYGLDHYEISMRAIGEVTKRNTGEYAIRPFIKKYPEQTLTIMEAWAKSPNFHLRRLASEGLRPKLPWAAKLEIFIDNPAPVFHILNLLREDEIMFVKKSVANHLTDWIKVNRTKAMDLIEDWRGSGNMHTQWIIKRATRKIVDC